ncbi:G2 and S phase-expressed protein 1 [Mugil cephalus]|uniref:G2 and S phase-expressed protein 1 n=1 Tax=Mugil cephalus TaxID=48193 RepID=UPI001FB6928E|nr:G2 and S phase-expressed protein 1 [Mugil cephalus]XP_047451489.1 G2 and S phase-expressed protein 1 [Mugil cephalus]
MDCEAHSDVFFLPDEKFDFDVSMSPASSTGDDDEVFVGPVSHKERCVSVCLTSQLEDGDGDVRVSWSPLTGDQLEAVCQEAHRLANDLKSSETHTEDCDTTTGTTDTTTEREEFVQDAEAKLGMLGQTASVLSPIKRQTFCVQDSPMKQLPPTIRRYLLRGSTSNISLSTRSAATTAPSTRSTRNSTSSPVAGPKAQSRTALRGKAALGSAAVLPSKPAAPRTSCSASKSRVEKTRLQQPSKVAGWRRSPSVGPSSRAESYEDLLSDSASVASDISDSSLNSSLLGKRTLGLPTKSAGVRNLSGVKAPPPQSRRMTDRKNTSSSSSSVSSFNSTLSLSPTKGKLNSSLNRSVSGSTGPAPSSISRQTNHSRPRRSTVYTAAEPVASSVGRRSLSTQVKKLSDAELVKATRSTPLKRGRAEVTPLQPTPNKRTASIPSVSSSRLQSGLKAKPKPEALVLPTPSTGGKGVQNADDVSKVLRPKRLMSSSSKDSLPQKPSAGPLTPSNSCKSLQIKARRPSALPTPVRRRTSAIPTPTPSNQTRTLRTPAICAPEPTLTLATDQYCCSPVSRDIQGEEGLSEAPIVQPFCLEEEESVAVPPSNTPQPEQSESMDTGELSQSQSVPSKNLIELETTEESNFKTQEVLLLDLPAPTLQPQEKLLIDLTNTPDLVRTSSKTCTTTQLIDLSSPLIKWSPDDKRENNAPLINLSF